MSCRELWLVDRYRHHGSMKHDDRVSILLSACRDHDSRSSVLQEWEGCLLQIRQQEGCTAKSMKGRWAGPSLEQLDSYQTN